MIEILIIIYLSVILWALLYNPCKDDKTTNNIKTLLRQAARWSTAAEQDENSMVAVMHANYGAAYLWALKDIATDDEIRNAGVDPVKFKNEIVRIQDNATRNMAKLCPKYAPKPTYLTKIGGEGN